MDDFQSIEDKLSRMLPPSISEEGQARLEETIDQLAGHDTGLELADEYASNKPRKHHWAWKAAAAITLLAVPTVMVQLKTDSLDALLSTSSRNLSSTSELVVLKSTNRIDGREDDGLIIPDNGSSPYYRYRYHVTDEEQVRDAKTGTIITLRQPRQEVVTIPVTQF